MQEAVAEPFGFGSGEVAVEGEVAGPGEEVLRHADDGEMPTMASHAWLMAKLAEVEEGVPRREAVAAHLHEKDGDLELAARLYAEAARHAPNLAERDHQTRQAARVNQQLRGGSGT